MKICFKCKESKPLDSFYKHKGLSDGLLNKCKDCTKLDTKNRANKLRQNPEWVESERDRGREKYHRLYVGTGKTNRPALLKFFDKYPEKYKAITSCRKLEKPFEFAERHHWSYNEEHYKDVIWLIKKHHAKAHRFIVYDQERMKYRRYDTNELLDTKEQHEEFILDCIKNKKD